MDYTWSSSMMVSPHPSAFVRIRWLILFFDDGESPMLLCVIDDPLQLQIAVDFAVVIDICCSHCLLCFQLVNFIMPMLFMASSSSVLDITPSPLVSMPSSHSQNSFTVIFFPGFVWWTALLPFVWTRNVQRFHCKKQKHRLTIRRGNGEEMDFWDGCKGCLRGLYL